jgi:hypothetical protein
VSRTQLLASDAGLLFTLYRGHHDEGHGSYAFVHTLGLGNGVWCLAVPDSMQLADEPGALALDASGDRLLAVSANGAIAAIPLASIVDLNALPEFGAPHPLGARTERAPAVAVADDVIWVALGDRLVRVDSASLEPTAMSHLPVDVEALGVTSDGGLAAAGAGRLLVIGDDGQVQEDHELPDGLGAVARILTPRRSA